MRHGSVTRVMNKKTIGNVIFVLLVVLLLLGVLYFFALPFFGYTNYVVLSNSMEPTIHRGNIVLVKTCDSEMVQVNDVITFYDRNGNVTMHRVVEKQEKLLKTKGDANNVADAYLIDEEHLIGIVKFRLPIRIR